METAKKLQTLLMMIRRNQTGQMSLELGPVRWEEFENVFKDHQAVANYYFSIDNDIPFYFGMTMLKKISSFNIEQFLSFSGGIFSLSRAERIISGNAIKITADQQQEFLVNMAEKRWNDILVRFTDGKKIQNLLTELCGHATRERLREANSYSGGTFSGIGIEDRQLEIIVSEDKYKELREVLKECISAWYFEKRRISQNNKNWTVLYYNRWICLKFKLPFAYGGWHSISAEKLSKCLFSKNVDIDSGYEYATTLIGE